MRKIFLVITACLLVGSLVFGGVPDTYRDTVVGAKKLDVSVLWNDSTYASLNAPRSIPDSVSLVAAEIETSFCYIPGTKHNNITFYVTGEQDSTKFTAFAYSGFLDKRVSVTAMRFQLTDSLQVTAPGVFNFDVGTDGITLAKPCALFYITARSWAGNSKAGNDSVTVIRAIINRAD